MKKTFITLIFTVFTLIYVNGQEFNSGEIMIKIENSFADRLNPEGINLGIPALDKLNAQSHLIEVRPIGHYKKTHTFLLKFEENSDVNQLIKSYSNLDEVAYAEPNFIGYGAGQGMQVAPDDAYYYLQWNMKNDGSFDYFDDMSSVAGADANMEPAWDIETGDPDMIISVSDTGLRYTHEDIAARVWQNPEETQNGADSDENGYVDDYMGWNWIDDNNNPADDHGHGTNVAGIIGAIANNGKGYAGGNWNSKIMVLKVLDSNNSGTYADMASSMYYAVDNGSKIMNMSISGSSQSQILYDAVEYMYDHGAMLVTCMHNGNTDVLQYPAKYSLDFDNVISVGSTDADDSRSQPFFWDPNSGSNYGTHINLVAPGNYIYGLGLSNNSSYNWYYGGTSQATPLVAAIASLIWAINPELTPGEIRDILQNTADDQVGNPAEDTPGFDIYYGWGRVNAHQALLAAQATLNTDKFEVAGKGIKIANPIKNNKLEFFSNLDFEGKAKLTLIAFDGRIIKDESIEISQGYNQLQLGGLASGSYILTLEAGTYSKVFKVVL